MLPLFNDEDAGAFAHDEAIAVAVERGGTHAVAFPLILGRNDEIPVDRPTSGAVVFRSSRYSPGAAAALQISKSWGACPAAW